jgi:hypothetical protein
MNIIVKLTQATYDLSIKDGSMTLYCTKIGIGKAGIEKEITSTLGFFGPFQIEHAYNRIAFEELSLNNDTTDLYEFLSVYKTIAEQIMEQAEGIKATIKENRLQTTK